LIDFSEQFKLGGFGSLRGYRQDQFAGRRTLLGQLEIRWRQSSKFAFYVFGDLGVIYLKKESIEKKVDSETLTQIGSGFGIFIGSKTATLTLELGWGEEDSLGDGKIHMGLVTMF
jgi:hemolysin activation/secretion protein